MIALTLNLRPRFNDTDALGHINSASVASILIQHKEQLHYQHEVEISTQVQKIGTASFTLLHQALQNRTLAAEGTATLVHFNYELPRPTPLTGAPRTQLSSWMSAI